MTQIVLPITSRANTDPNNFSDVYSNDNAIATVVNGDLRNDNLAAAGTANIAVGKLAAGTPGQIIVCTTTSGIPTYRTPSGDVTVSSTGVTSIANDAVTSAKIAADAVDTSEIAASAVGTSELASGAVTNGKLGCTASTDTLSNSVTLTGSYQTLASVSVTSGHSYLVVGSVQLLQQVVSVSGGDLADTTISLAYNGSEHATDGIVAVGSYAFPIGFAVAITSGTTIDLKAKRSGLGDVNVRGADVASGYTPTRLTVFQYS